jgi:hypothetical protein
LTTSASSASARPPLPSRRPPPAAARRRPRDGGSPLPQVRQLEHTPRDRLLAMPVLREGTRAGLARPSRLGTGCGSANAAVTVSTTVGSALSVTAGASSSRARTAAGGCKPDHPAPTQHHRNPRATTRRGLPRLWGRPGPSHAHPGAPPAHVGGTICSVSGSELLARPVAWPPTAGGAR